MMARWMVIVSSADMIDDIRRATDDQVSFREAVAEVSFFRYSGNIVLGIDDS